MEKKKHSKKLIDLKQIPHYSLLVPFSPLMIKPKRLINLLQTAGDKAERELKAKYSLKQAIPLIKDVRDLIRKVKCIPADKTLLIQVSSFAKKIYYFNTTKRLTRPSL